MGTPGEEKPAALGSDGSLYDLSSITDDITGEFLDSGLLALARHMLETGGLPLIEETSSLRIGPPIVRPSAVIGIGINYAAHAAESGALPPDAPVIFLKPPNTVTGPNDDVRLPRGSRKTDWEVELGIVIGRRASYLDSPRASEAHVAGYVLVNDLSEREFQLELSGGQWSKGKAAAGFTPVGPWLVTADEVRPNGLRLRSSVNGEPRQDSSTADMLFDVDYLVWYLSQYMVLEPGDLILTGTPEGVALSGRFPYLTVDDTVEVEIDGLGRQTQQIVAYQAEVRR